MSVRAAKKTIMDRMNWAADPGALDGDPRRFRLLDLALASAVSGVVITNRDGTILCVNPAFCGLTGYCPDELLGRNPRMFKSGRHDAKFYQEFWTTLLSGRTWHGEFVNRRKDGTIYTVEQKVAPVRDEGGEISHFISVSEDVTEQKRLEEELRQAQKLQAVGQLASGVAHVFNNLLTVIRGNTELVLLHHSGLSPEKSAELLRNVLASADRASLLTRQLLTFSRQQARHNQTLDLMEFIQSFARDLRNTAGKRIRVETRCAPDLPRVRADAASLLQVVTNLASNAVEVMPSGGRLVLATQRASVAGGGSHAHPESRPGDFACLSVQDEGPGVAPENLPRIFEPFFTTKDISKGSGLGLAIVYGIVKQHQGWIEVVSEANHGTTFKVYLPLADVPEASLEQGSE
jgi:two-component system NtrC family sensor kinase